MNGYALRLRGIRFVAHFGVSAEERSTGQDILVDVDLELPYGALPRRDRRGDVVDYDAVVTRVVEEGLSDQFRLLETFVARVVGLLLEDTPAFRVRVAATKARAPTKYPLDSAIVEIVRTRDT